MSWFEAALILLLGSYYVLASSNQCRTSELCTCIKTAEKYEFQCSSDNNGVLIHTSPNKSMKIDCVEKEFDLDILPNYTAGRIEILEIRFCSLSPDDFFSLLRKFHIEHVEYLRLEDIVLKNDSTEETIPITKYFFQGFSSLRTLDISYLNSPLDVDAFQNLPNLTTLYLEKSNIEEIDGLFRNLKYLTILHLSRNSIADIPDATFQDLTELQQLHLWKNNLTRIKKSYFSGLCSLKSLELSRNYIQFIEKDAFSDLSELVDFSLRENQLGLISSDLFRQKEKLRSLRIDYNFNVTLSDYAFANLSNLSVVNLATSGLQNIPARIFDGSENIEIIMMQNNLLQDLPEDVFLGLKQLKELYLTGNNISSIPDELFSPLVNLKILELGGNMISEINSDVFKMNKNLEKLYVNDNRIKTISQNAFYNHGKLIFMDFSNNFYDMKYDIGGHPFMNCYNLEQLLLSGNRIDEFPSDIVFMVHLTRLNLSHNDISEIMVSELATVSGKKMTIDLSENKISLIDFQVAEVTARTNAENLQNGSMLATTVLLFNNSLVCDCRNYDLVRYIRDKLDPNVKMMVKLELGDENCALPEIFQHIKIEDLQPQHISCPFPLKCNSSSDCQCFYRPFDRIAVVDCSYKNLTECPRIEVNSGRVELNLVGNMISDGPNSTLGYDNVTNLLLSNNWIEQFKWVPPTTKVLELDGNRLKHIDSEVLEMMNSTSVLKLSNNPWVCDCSAFEFQNFIRAKFGKESTDIVCKDDNKPLIEKKVVCKPISTLIMQIAIPILLLVVLIAVGTALFFYYETEIKIWLFGMKWLRWLVSKHELDKNKKFDIFLSYSNEDEEFVVRNLLPLLEEGPDPFRICIHTRDWKAGETITNQIAESVNDSRRTMVVLTNNFLKSVWGKMEFITAHTRAMEEKTARVIIIKYGELDEEKLDEELKMYLKTNTYVEWGDPWFRNKVRYALPHFRSRNMNNNQKHANMMLKIDDKFELTRPPLAHPESTPPVVGLDPGTLKSSPLGFKRWNNNETPPAETPLVIERD